MAEQKQPSIWTCDVCGEAKTNFGPPEGWAEMRLQYNRALTNKTWEVWGGHSWVCMKCLGRHAVSRQESDSRIKLTVQKLFSFGRK